MPDFPIRVKVDPSNAVKGTQKVEAGLKRVENRADVMRKTMARAFSLAGAGFALVAGIRIMKDFSQEMSTVESITKATGDSLRQLRDTAKDLGATTRFSATQAAEGMAFLARAGFDTNQVMESVDDTLRLAQAGALDLGRAADIASNVLTAFRIDVGEAARVVDVLAYAANNANTNVSQLGDGMKLVAPIAAGLDVSLETSTAAMSALSDSGLQATLAGTGLRRVMSELESPASKTSKILASLGLTTDEVKISQVGLVEALTKLRDAGVDTGQALEIFGDRGGPAFEVMSKSIPKIIEMEKALLNSAGTAEAMAKIMDDNLNGALLASKSALEAVIIAFGDLGAESYLKDFFFSLAGILRTVAAEIETVTRVAGALAIVLAVNLAQKAIGAVITGIKALSVAILANPFGALATVILTIISFLITFSDQIKLSSDGLVTLKDYGIATFQIMQEKLGPLIIAIQEGFTGAIKTVESLLGGLGLTFNDVLNVVKIFVNSFIGTFVGMYRMFGVVFKGMKKILTDFFSSGTVEFKNYGGEIRDAFIGGFAQDFVGDFAAVLSPAFGEIGDRARQLANERMAADKQAQAAKAAAVASLKDVGGSAAKDYDRSAVQDILNDLSQQADLLKLTNAERSVQNDLIKIQNDLQKENITLSDSEKQLIEERLKGLQSLQLQSELYATINERATEFSTTQAALNTLYADGRISLDEYNQALAETQLGADVAGLKDSLFVETSSITEILQAQLTERQALIDEAFSVRLINEQEHLDLSLQANEAYNAAITANELARQKILLGSASSIFDALASVTETFKGKQNKTYKALFTLSKAFAIAESGVAIVQGISKSAALGWPANIAAIAATIAQTAGLVSQIKSISYKGGYKTGGSFEVQGQGGPDSQRVAFDATPGERVDISTPAQQKESAAAPAESRSPDLNIVNILDPSIVEDFLTSAEGEHVLVNSISNNKESINATLQQ